MKHKLRVHTTRTEPFKIFPQYGYGIMRARQLQRTQGKIFIEESILSMFDIDSETMEEHLEELRIFMMLQEPIPLLNHDKTNLL